MVLYNNWMLIDVLIQKHLVMSQPEVTSMTDFELWLPMWPRREVTSEHKQTLGTTHIYEKRYFM